MSKLAYFFNPSEKEILYDALTKLFSFQGKIARVGEVVFWADEIAQWGYDFKTVLAGIESLHDAELKTLTLPTVRRAISDKVKPAPPQLGEFENETPLEIKAHAEKTAKLKAQYGDAWYKHWGDDITKPPQKPPEWDAVEPL